MMGLSLVTAITAAVVVTRGPVAADQVSDLKAKAAQVSKDLVLQQLQVDTYQQQYGADVTKVQQDEAAIGSTENQIQADSSRVSRDRQRLQSEAVWTYIHLGGDASGTPTIFENQTVAPTRAEYEDVASGDIALTIDAVHIDENRLRAERATLAQQKAQDQATTDQEATLTDDARADRGRARGAAVPDHGPAGRGGGSTAGGAGHSRRRRGAVGTGQGRRGRTDVVTGVSDDRQWRRRQVPPVCPARPARPPQTRSCRPSSNASCRRSQVATTKPCRRTASTWVGSNSASRRGTRRRSSPACHS